MGERDETEKLEEDFHEPAEEQLDAVDEDREEKASMADHDSSKEPEDELHRLKKQLSIAEEERHRAETELEKMKVEDDEANLRLSEALAAEKAELEKVRTEANEANSRLTEALAAEKAEVELVKKSLASTNRELKNKEEEIESLKTLERKIGEKDAELEKLNETLVEARNLEPRVRELEQELERLKESEAKAVESLAVTKKELEELKVRLEESRVSACSLRDKHEESLRGDGEKDMSSRGYDEEDNTPRKDSDLEVDEMLETLADELQLTKESLFRAQEGERAALSKAQSLLSEIGKLRNELKLATNAEINSAKAMDDLAVALSEVAAESNKVKMRLEVVEVELESSRREVEELKLKGKSAEEMYVSLLEESRREAEEYKKKAELSILEAEETLSAWNEKETGFVKCIRRAEDEKSLVVEENIRLLDTIKRAENAVKASKEENAKLRDILKQALSEANVAKEAANIAKAENAQLKDCLADKEEALEFLTMEIENLKANEAELMSKVKKSESGTPSPTERETGSEGSLGDKEGGSKNDKELLNIKKQPLVEKESPKILAKAFSFNLKELRIHTKHSNKDVDSGDEKNKYHTGDERDADDEDSEDYDPLKGSIFDVMDSPGSARHRRKGSGFSGDGTALTAEELAQLEDSHLHDLETGRFSSRRRRLLRKFGDLIIRRRPSYAEQTK